jgi:hypothetical protein
VAIGDFNGDGKGDVAVACAGSTPSADPGTISVLLSNGDGTFRPAQNFAAGTTPLSVAVADLNGDGALDLVAANSSDDTVSVLLGNGDGTFQAPLNFATGSYPRFVAVGEFNGDGKLDLVIANQGRTACTTQCSAPDGSVSVLLGNGDGTFQAPLSFTAGNSPQAVVVADFNGDARSDVAVIAGADAANSNNVAVLLGNGDGTFQMSMAFAVRSAFSVAVGDFNADGRVDLVVGGDGVNIAPGNGDGTFQAVQTFAPYNSFRLAVGDLNRDGKPDVVTQTIAVLINNTEHAIIPTYSFTVSKDGNGDGTVTGSPSPTGDAIDCGTACTATYDGGTVVTLTAQAALGSTFASWSGCDAVSGTTCTVTMNEARSVVATFVLEQFGVTVTKSGIGAGTVTSTSNPAAATQINCGATCSASYDWNTIVTLTATRGLTSVFLGWSGCDAYSYNTCTVTVRSARDVSATFQGVPLLPPLKPRF